MPSNTGTATSDQAGWATWWVAAIAEDAPLEAHGAAAPGMDVVSAEAPVTPVVRVVMGHSAETSPDGVGRPGAILRVGAGPVTAGSPAGMQGPQVHSVVPGRRREGNALVAERLRPMIGEAVEVRRVRAKTRHAPIAATGDTGVKASRGVVPVRGMSVRVVTGVRGPRGVVPVRGTSGAAPEAIAAMAKGSAQAAEARSVAGRRVTIGRRAAHAVLAKIRREAREKAFGATRDARCGVPGRPVRIDDRTALRRVGTATTGTVGRVGARECGRIDRLVTSAAPRPRVGRALIGMR